MFSKKTVRDIDVANKKVIVRAMLNVPIEDGKVGDLMRLKAALPTLTYLLEQNAAVILISHHSSEGQSLAPVALVLAELIGRQVEFVDDCLSVEAREAAEQLQPGNILMLENLRFYKEEEADDDVFARKLAHYADVYVNDDFTTCHREHASMVGIPHYLPAVAGFGVEKEVETITSALENPKRPLVAVTGGAKISTKIPIVSFLIDKVDALFVGGAMANTFLLAMGKPVGKSLVEPDQVENAIAITQRAMTTGKKLLLPLDVVVTSDVATQADIRTVSIDEIGADDVIADLGPESVAQLRSVLSADGTVVWNGPIGIAEKEAFAKGTAGVAEAIIGSGAYSVIGGGDTADYIDGAGLAEKFNFVSTGGGASLELMSGDPLPGVEALLEK